MRRLLDTFILWLALAIALHAALPLLVGRQTIVTLPAPFLPPAQEIGITLIAILIGALGSTRIAEAIEPYMAQLPYLAEHWSRP